MKKEALEKKKKTSTSSLTQAEKLPVNKIAKSIPKPKKLLL
jgi:hypothetical protein